MFNFYTKSFLEYQILSTSLAFVEKIIVSDIFYFSLVIFTLLSFCSLIFSQLTQLCSNSIIFWLSKLIIIYMLLLGLKVELIVHQPYENMKQIPFSSNESQAKVHQREEDLQQDPLRFSCPLSLALPLSITNLIGYKLEIFLAHLFEGELTMSFFDALDNLIYQNTQSYGDGQISEHSSEKLDNINLASLREHCFLPDLSSQLYSLEQVHQLELPEGGKKLSDFFKNHSSKIRHLPLMLDDGFKKNSFEQTYLPCSLGSWKIIEQIEQKPTSHFEKIKLLRDFLHDADNFTTQKKSLFLIQLQSLIHLIFYLSLGSCIFFFPISLLFCCFGKSFSYLLKNLFLLAGLIFSKSLLLFLERSCCQYIKYQQSLITTFAQLYSLEEHCWFIYLLLASLAIFFLLMSFLSSLQFSLFFFSQKPNTLISSAVQADTKQTCSQLASRTLHCTTSYETNLKNSLENQNSFNAENSHRAQKDDYHLRDKEHSCVISQPSLSYHTTSHCTLVKEKKFDLSKANQENHRESFSSKSSSQNISIASKSSQGSTSQSTDDDLSLHKIYHRISNIAERQEISFKDRQEKLTVEIKQPSKKN